MTLKGLKVLVIINIILATIALVLLALTARADEPVTVNEGDIVVVEIDTGVDYTIPAIGEHIPDEYKKAENLDTSVVRGRILGHGTHVAGLILDGVCKQVKLIPCKFWSSDGRLPSVQTTTSCFNFAKDKEADIVNYSAGGIEANETEYNAVKAVSESGAKIVVALGNDHMPVFVQKDPDKFTAEPAPAGYESYYPACYNIKNLIRVQSLDVTGQLSDTSNYSKRFKNRNDKYLKGETYTPPRTYGFDAEVGVEVESYYPGGGRAIMSGTSQAAAKVTNKILKKMCNELNAQ